MSTTTSPISDDIPDFLLRKNWINGMPPAVHPPMADKPQRLIGTYTILSTYKNCPEQMRRRYITKDLGAFVKTKEMEWGDAVHKAFELRLKAKKPLPVEMQEWEQFAAPFDSHKVLVEQRLGLSREGRAHDYWDNAQVWFRGQADVAILNGTAAYIADLKTGNSKYEDPFEVATNALLLQAHYPQITTIKGQYIWLKENRMGQLYDVSNTRATFGNVCELMDEIEGRRAANQWEKRKSGLCSWCNVKDCENWRPRT